MADNKPSIEFHESGKKHKENVSKRLKEIHKNSAKQAKQNKKFENDIKKMENAAMAAYLKDIENNTRDMTADRIIKEKLNRIEAKDISMNPNRNPAAAPETTPRFKGNSQQFPQEIDPCDPLSKTVSTQSKNQPPRENRTQGKGKPNKGKGKGKKPPEDDRPNKPVRKLWYEALSPEGYTYYWHIETDQSVWEPPEEGYMTIAEQEEEAKEQQLQQQLLEQLEKEEAVSNADILEEKRANAERERMKEQRKQLEDSNSNEAVDQELDEESKQKDERPYRRDYSIPEKTHPYGPWQTVRKTTQKPVDLQLPQQKEVQLPVFVKSEPALPQRVFKEKTVTQISAGDSDGEQPTTFKKRKIGNKNVRKRLTDD